MFEKILTEHPGLIGSPFLQSPSFFMMVPTQIIHLSVCLVVASPHKIINLTRPRTMKGNMERKPFFRHFMSQTLKSQLLVSVNTTRARSMILGHEYRPRKHL